MGAVVVGMFLASINAFLNGTPGAKHHLGYGMLARSAFGLWGSYFCIMLNVFQSFVFYVSSSGALPLIYMILICTGYPNVLWRPGVCHYPQLDLPNFLADEEYFARKV